MDDDKAVETGEYRKWVFLGYSNDVLIVISEENN
jgi:hypothetical protein